MEERLTSVGKEVLLDGKHFADAASEEAARVIVTCLNRYRTDMSSYPFCDEEDRKVQEFFA